MLYNHLLRIHSPCKASWRLANAVVIDFPFGEMDGYAGAAVNVIQGASLGGQMAIMGNCRRVFVFWFMPGGLFAQGLGFCSIWRGLDLQASFSEMTLTFSYTWDLFVLWVGLNPSINQ